ncbi:glycosyltransferase family 2 protein [Tsuneonella sp. YG55]|uniref:Glycosyltransferase family 2 protein n=1 Tax=Tsuneonella litorea TaxID=2976475 RepID=A0A9X3A8F0_9SPHN|nr:glycosyltransferase [Tsuneonella litorea]MCT2559411.1 glycosyltransferase family 2 protein [Tsuneonella litorea]
MTSAPKITRSNDLRLNAEEGAAGISVGRIDSPRRKTGLYLPLRVKFTAACLIAILWTAFSIALSLPWLRDLSAIVGVTIAAVIIAFIAYIPGFMNAFLLSTLLFDRNPPRRRVNSYPGTTILVAAYNEASAIYDTLASLAGQDYPGKVQILVLNDGSSDNTVALAKEAIAELRFPRNIRARVLDFPTNRGKSAVLNDGLAKARHDLVVTIDGDSWVKRDGLRKLVERFLSDPPDTRAVAGAVMVRNSRANFLARAQEWDYFHGIASVKRMQGMYHGTLVAQGAFSIYRRDALREVGGWPECVGEDIVLSWALLARDYRIGYADDALAFTNVPTTLRQFALQRKRWSRGLMEAFKAHSPLLFKRRMSTLFVWWNVCFLPLDLVYTLVFIPGLVLACFGYFYIAGPLTIAVLPLTILWNGIIFRIQSRVYEREGLIVRRNIRGFFFYALAYSILLQPVCVWGYLAELLGLRKRWDTK